VGHISDIDFERYHLGVVKGEELARLEEHILGCPPCAELAEAFAEYLDAVKTGLAEAGLDLSLGSGAPSSSFREPGRGS
jgi:hypothetical protein